MLRHFNGRFFGEFFLSGGFGAILSCLLEQFFLNDGFFSQFLLGGDVFFGYTSVVFMVRFQNLPHNAVGTSRLGHAGTAGHLPFVARGSTSGTLEIGCARAAYRTAAVGY